MKGNTVNLTVYISSSTWNCYGMISCVCVCVCVICSSRLVTKGSVDENIYEIARRKLVLDAAILQSGAELDNSTDVPEKTMGEILASLLLAWSSNHGVSQRYLIWYLLLGFRPSCKHVSHLGQFLEVLRCASMMPFCIGPQFISICLIHQFYECSCTNCWIANQVLVLDSELVT